MATKKNDEPEVTAEADPAAPEVSPAELEKQREAVRPETLTTTDLREAAQDLEISGRTKMSREDLAAKIIETVTPALAVPPTEPQAALPPQPEPGNLPT